MKIGVHEVVGKKHLEVNVHSRRHHKEGELGHDPHSSGRIRGRSSTRRAEEFSVLGNGGPFLPALHQHAIREENRDGKRDRFPLLEVLIEKVEMFAFHGEVGLRGDCVRELVEGLGEIDPRQSGEALEVGSQTFHDAEVDVDLLLDIGVSYLDRHFAAMETSEVDLRDGSRGDWSRGEEVEDLFNRAAELGLDLALGEGVGVGGGIGVKSGKGGAKLLWKHIWSSGSPLAPLYEGGSSSSHRMGHETKPNSISKGLRHVCHARGEDGG